MTYPSRVFGPGWAGRTVSRTNTRLASWPRVRSSAWGSAGLAAAGLAAVIDTGGAAAHATLESIIAPTTILNNRLRQRMAGTGYTARLQPDWQSGLCIDGVQPGLPI